MTLTDFLKQNRKGTFCVKARRIGRPHSRRIIEVPPWNHQDIWVWYADRQGNRTNVEARINRRQPSNADDYEIKADSNAAPE